MARATVRAQRVTAAADEAIARLNAAPQAKAQDFAVLQATVARVDEENGQLRGKQARFDALLGGFSRTVNRLIYRMERAGIPAEPDDIDELVRDYMRTGA
ncbi:putative regulatory protein [Streptomyces sp. ACT-1]|nr:putative regulatory protein [Streptomyces sp. ACT-1]